jgi:hypothetical protein
MACTTPRPILVITGGRDREPRLTELGQLAEIIKRRQATKVRDGDCRGTDRSVRAWLKARQLVDLDPWPADTAIYGPWPGAGPKRNGAMLDGDRVADLFGAGARPPADMLVAFAGGSGTADCTTRALERGLPVEWIEPASEPLIANRHHFKGEPPEPWVYVGRGSPLGNPFTLEQHGEAAMDLYKRHLWARMQARDRSVLAALDALTPDHRLVCSCWPRPCHAEVIVRAWRWLRSSQKFSDSPSRSDTSQR